MSATIVFQAAIPKNLALFIRSVPRHAAVKVIKPAVMKSLKAPMREYKSRLKRLPWSKGKTKDPPHMAKVPPKPMHSVIGVTAVHWKNGNVFGAMGPRSNENIHHAWLLEHGSKPHFIKAGTFRGRKTGKKLLVGPPPFGRPRRFGAFNTFGPHTDHHGHKPGRHLEKTAKSNFRKIEAIFMQTAKKRVNIVLRSLAKQKVRREIIGHLKGAGFKTGKGSGVKVHIG